LGFHLSQSFENLKELERGKTGLQLWWGESGGRRGAAEELGAWPRPATNCHTFPLEKLDSKKEESVRRVKGKGVQKLPYPNLQSEDGPKRLTGRDTQINTKSVKMGKITRGETKKRREGGAKRL